MKFYFSGIDSPKTYALLEKAGVSSVLIDQFDIKNVPVTRQNVMLDSGAYRAWKNGWTLDVDFYAEIIKDIAPFNQFKFDRITTLDVFQDNRQSFENWIRLRNDHKLTTMPVWFYTDDEKDEKRLHQYMLLSDVVGIGGLVPAMRAKEQSVLDNLHYLCKLYPKRCHFFGLNWLKAIAELKDVAFSADTSKWLDGARYRHLIYFDQERQELVQTTSDLSRETLCIQNAKNLEAFVLGLSEPLPENQTVNWGNESRKRVYKINMNRKFQAEVKA